MKIAETIKVRTNQDETILIFDPDRDFFHELNNTASEMFLLMKAGKNKNEIVTILYDKYDLEEKVISEELDNFIKELIKLGVLEND